MVKFAKYLFFRKQAYCYKNKNNSDDTNAGEAGRTPLWAEGLVLRADGFETLFYKKE
ncbi:MAG: hypothetical protein NC249_07380 [Lachnoclostridium sp.]|nr:hypothetical protein [Lachnoclostridium sp.]